MSQILIVDDEVGIRDLLSEILSEEGHQVLLAENADAARHVRAFALVLARKVRRLSMRGTTMPTSSMP